MFRVKTNNTSRWILLEGQKRMSGYIDADNVKHGEWYWGSDVRCSCCGYKLETTGLPLECPACRAKMDKEKEG